MGSEARTCRSASIHSNMARCSASPKLSGQKKASAEARGGSGEWGAGSGELGVEAGEVRPRWDAQLQHTCRKNPPAGPAAWCDKDASQWKAHLCCTPARAAGPDRRSSTGCRPAAAAAWQTAPCGRGGQAEGPEHALSRRRMGRFGAAVQPTAAKSRLPLASREQTLVAAAA